MNNSSERSRLRSALSRWNLSLIIALLLLGIWAWLDVSLRFLPQQTQPQALGAATERVAPFYGAPP
ncbi:MAG: hypothetical protein JNK21_16585 [Rhodospirillaceae bacterium]|nr:hypothetical protein [Rhodospirillaceae bacterium]